MNDPSTAAAFSPTSMARRSVALLLAINLLNYVDRYVLSAVVPHIQEQFFVPGDENAKFWIGTLNTAFLFSYMLAAPLFGWLADRASRWVLIGGAVIAWSLASGASGLATSFGMLLATRLFVGIGEAAFGPAAPTLVADLYPIERRGTVLSWLYVAIPVGSALGFILGGVIASHWDWRTAFFAVVGPGILVGLLCFLMRDPRQAPGGGNASAGRRMNAAAYRTLLETPSYLFTTAGMTAMTFAMGAVAFWMPDYIHKFRGQPDLGKVNMLFGGLTALAGILATPIGGIVADRLTRRHPGAYFWFSGATMLLAFPCFLLVLVLPFPFAWGAIFVTEFLLFLNTGPTNTILANVTHPSVRATGYAVNILVIHVLGDAISPPLVGKVTGLWGGNMDAGFVVVSLAILVGGVLWMLGTKHLPGDTARAPTRLAE